MPRREGNAQSEVVEAIISGDARRRALAEAVANMMGGYGCVSEIHLIFERNPAIAFNKGARLAKTRRVVCLGGDVFVDEANLLKLLSKGGDVVFAVPRVTQGEVRFVSGLFVAKRDIVLAHPLPESPDFLEEVYWYEPLKQKLSFVACELEFEHRQVHSISHKVLRRFARARARLRIRRGRVAAILYPLAFLKIAFESLGGR